MIYAIDSDILSYMLKENRNVQTNFFKLVDDDDYCIPPIVYYEVKRGLTYINAQVKLNALAELYDGSVQNDVMTAEMWRKAIDIYVMLKAKGRMIGDGDIFIASFCIVNDYTLITNNTQHYDNIPELKKVNIV